MKRFILSLIVTLSMAVPSFAQRATCDPNLSRLCVSILAYYNFEEASDSLRKDSFLFSDLREGGAVNIGRNTGKIGSFAVDFPGSGNASRLFFPNSAGFGNGFWTAAMWIYPTTNGASGSAQTLIAKDSTNDRQFHVYLANNGSYITPAFVAFTEEGTQVTLNPAVQVTLNTWHLLAFGVSPNVFGANDIWLSLDGGTKYTQAINGNLRTTLNSIELGARLAGQGTTQTSTAHAALNSTPFGWTITCGTAAQAVATLGDGCVVQDDNFNNPQQSNVVFAYTFSPTIPADATVSVVTAYTRWTSNGSAGNCRVNVKLGAATTFGNTIPCPTVGTGLISQTYARPGGGSWTYADLANLAMTFEGLDSVSLQKFIEVDEAYFGISWAAGFQNSPYTGRIDGLVFAGRTWAQQDIALYWNNGTGITFPFNTPQ